MCKDKTYYLITYEIIQKRLSNSDKLKARGVMPRAFNPPLLFTIHFTRYFLPPCMYMPEVGFSVR